MALPSTSRNARPLPERRCIRKPSPPKNPRPRPGVTSTETSTPGVAQRKALFWQMYSRPGPMGSARIDPGKEEARAICWPSAVAV